MSTNFLQLMCKSKRREKGTYQKMPPSTKEPGGNQVPKQERQEKPEENATEITNKRQEVRH